MRTSIARVVGAVALVVSATIPEARAADAVCVKIRLVIPQRLTMERDAFDASLELTNTLTDTSLEGLDIVVQFKTFATQEPAEHLFFTRLVSDDGIAGGITGSGAIAAEGRGMARWLIIPTIGAGGTVPGGQQYRVKATIHYTVNGLPFTTETYEEVITVQPQPELVLDYALPGRVKGDNPFTPEEEPVVPFEFALRVSNVGAGPARNLRVVTAQPRIVENEQGALIDFQILGTFRDDQTIANTLAIPFGTLGPASCSTGAWAMSVSHQGEFTQMSASFEHREDLGGAMTSLIREVRTFRLIHRVLLDSPGKDTLADQLVDLSDPWDGVPDVVQESQCGETPVVVVSGVSSGTPSYEDPTYTVVATVAPTWNYFVVTDPAGGRYNIRRVVRVSDGKVFHRRNAWLTEDALVDPPLPQAAFLDFFPAASPQHEETYRVTLDYTEFDTVPPVSFLEPQPPYAGSNPLYVTPTTVMVVRADDDNSGVARTEYRKDGGPWLLAGPFYLPTPGEHTVEFRSTDARGNQEAIQVVRVVVDGDGPVVTVVEPAPGQTYLPEQLITVDVVLADVDPAPSHTIALVPEGGELPIPVVNGQVIPAGDLAVGSYRVRVVATDWLGNATTHLSAPFLVQTVPGACDNVPTSTPCDDFEPCTVGDACSAGRCVGQPNPCDDGEVCTEDSCLTGLGCQHLPNTLPCDDGDACTRDDVCLGGGCVGVLIPCADGDVCTDDTCDPLLGCVFTPNSGPCDDGDACTSQDRCGASGCGGVAVECDDDNLCTSDRCVPATGCVQDPVEGPCDDGNDCTTVDACANGVCVGSAPKTAGTPCSDRNPCTSGDLCDDEGVCVGEDVACVEGTCSRQTCCGSGTVNCEDDDPCTDDVCDDEEGCLHVDRCGPDGGVMDGGPSVEEDGGVVSHDGGTEDAGVPVPLDGGTTTEDGGTVAVDAGGPDGGRDAGTSADAARPVDDAGVTLVDASSGVDAAARADAATVPVRPDGGGRPDAAGPTSWDAGTNPSGGGDDDDGTRDGSCGCGTSGSKRWPVSVAVLALVAMATRRRRGASASAGT